MLFDTPVYLLFLAVVVVVYWRMTLRKPKYIALTGKLFLLRMVGLAFLVVNDRIHNRGLRDRSLKLRTLQTRKRKALLIASLVLNFAILGFFKYFNFFLDSTVQVFTTFGFHHVPRSFLAIILPPGISFYTFQEVAYIVDVYGGRIKASRNFVDYGLFISLFPHLIAGPIQRPSHLLPQVQNPRAFKPSAFRDGCMLILMGFVARR